MKKCPNCDALVEKSRNSCPFCGEYLEVKKEPDTKPKFNFGEGYKSSMNNSIKQVDTGSTGYWLVGFVVPVLGFILYALWLREQPKNAHKCLYGALTAVVMYVLSIIIIVISFIIGIAEYGI